MSVLVDQYGLPLRRLKASEMGEDIAGHYDEFQAAAFALPPYNPDMFIVQRGWDTLEDMLSLAAVRVPLNIIRDSVLYKGWKIVPSISDQAHENYVVAAEMADALTFSLSHIVDEWGNAQDFRHVLFELLYAIHTGFRVSIINWRVLEDGPAPGTLGFASIAAKSCKQIGFDVDRATMAPRQIISYVPSRGYFPVPNEKCLRYTFGVKNNIPHGNGIGRVVYKHSWTIDFLYRFWNIGLEVFGSPFIMGKAETQAIPLARKILAEIRQGAPAVLPKNVEADLVETTGKGLDGFKAAVEHHVQQCAYGYLSNTLTTGEGQRTGSMALGRVHQDTQAIGLGGRRVDIENIVNAQLIRRWVDYNYGPAFRPLAPRLSLGDWDQEDMQGLASAFGTLVQNTVMHPGESQIRERMGLGPLEPELREIMEERWARTSAPPNPTPTSEGDDDPTDDNDNDENED